MTVLTPVMLAACDSSCVDPVPNSFDEVLSKNFDPDGPGVAAIVVKDGKTLFRSARGLANLEKGVPLRPAMAFHIASLTKPFTATAIMMLSEKGQLSLSDDITKYLPDFPTHGEQITIENLLTHTSGISNYTELPEFQKNMDKDLSLDELIDLFKYKPLEFAPGTSFSYSNSDYILLGAIIERITKQSYCSFMRKKIFEPLGMLNTKCGNSHSKVGRVIGYSRKNRASPISMTQTYAAGALVSTIDDLALFNEAISSERLLNQDTWDKIFTPFVLKDGQSTRTGYGWGIGDIKGRPTVGHKGKVNGFSSVMLRVPEEKLFVAVLSNDDRLHLLTEIESWFKDRSPACIARLLSVVALENYP